MLGGFLLSLATACTSGRPLSERVLVCLHFFRSHNITALTATSSFASPHLLRSNGLNVLNSSRGRGIRQRVPVRHSVTCGTILPWKRERDPSACRWRKRPIVAWRNWRTQIGLELRTRIPSPKNCCEAGLRADSLALGRRREDHRGRSYELLRGCAERRRRYVDIRPFPRGTPTFFSLI